MTCTHNIATAPGYQELTPLLGGTVTAERTFFGRVVVKINGNPLSFAAHKNIARTAFYCKNHSIEQVASFMQRVHTLHTKYAQEKAAMTLFQRVAQCALSFFRKNEPEAVMNSFLAYSRVFTSLQEKLERLSSNQMPDSERFYVYIKSKVESCIRKVLEDNAPVLFTDTTRQLEVALNATSGWERQTTHLPIHLLLDAFRNYNSEAEAHPQGTALAAKTLEHCLRTIHVRH